MLRVLRSEVFITLMQATLLMSLYELFFGNGYVNSTAIYLALLVSSCGLILGLATAAAAPTPKRKK
jgi:hypothetical protein